MTKCEICKRQSRVFHWSHGRWCKECSEMMLILNWSLPMPEFMDIDGIAWLNIERRRAKP